MIENGISDFRKKQEAIFTFNREVKKIIIWKNHLIRNWFQDEIKYKVLNELDDDSVYIHADWAMKFLPQKFHESQENWFGKKGISWHITCVVLSKNKKLTCITFAHLFDSTSQDVNAVITILFSVFSLVFKNIAPIFIKQI